MFDAYIRGCTLPDDELSCIDGWSDEELLDTAADYAGVGSDADLAHEDRFRASVSRLVAKVLAAERQQEGLSVFLLEPGGPKEAVKSRCTRVPMLDRGREPLGSRVWFVTHVVTAGEWVPARFEDDDDFFRFVSDELGAGHVPAIVFDPRWPGPELRYYPQGINELESVEPLRIAYSRISLEEILRRVDLVHRNQLVTPGAQPRGTKLWADAQRGVAAHNAEDLLSALLSAGLHAAFPNCRIRVEQPAPVGRLDIEVEERMPGQPGAVMRHAVLELKVLRGRNPNRTKISLQRIRQWIEEGVGQAASYREDKGALAAALCCFDMREEFTDQQCFAHVLGTAADLDVQLQVWHLFATSAAYRRYQASSGALTRRPADRKTASVS
jgi:hypothetical protein